MKAIYADPTIRGEDFDQIARDFYDWFGPRLLILEMRMQEAEAGLAAMYYNTLKKEYQYQHELIFGYKKVRRYSYK
jgi:hypothetical protein